MKKFLKIVWDVLWLLMSIVTFVFGVILWVHPDMVTVEMMQEFFGSILIIVSSYLLFIKDNIDKLSKKKDE